MCPEAFMVGTKASLTALPTSYELFTEISKFDKSLKLALNAKQRTKTLMTEIYTVVLSSKKIGKPYHLMNTVALPTRFTCPIHNSD